MKWCKSDLYKNIHPPKYTQSRFISGIYQTVILTLVQIEKGSPSVSLGAYFNVLRTLNLQDDILKLAADDEFGRKLQDLDLLN